MYHVEQTAEVGVEPLALNAARVHLRLITDPDDATAHPDDARIRVMIAAARKAAEAAAGYKIGVQKFDLRLDAFPRAPSIVLPISPVTAIDELRYFDTDGTEQTMPPADYQLDVGGLVQRVSLVPGAVWPTTQARAQAVCVSMTAGCADLPAPVAQWMLALICTMYEQGSAEVVGAMSRMQYMDGLLDPIRVPW